MAGVTWGRRRRGARAGVSAALTLLAVSGLGAAGPAASAAAHTAGTPLVGVVVREHAGAGDAPERAVQRLGGRVERQLDIIGGFSAELPADRLPVLRHSVGVSAVTPDMEVALSGASPAVQAANALPTSMYRVAQEVTGAAEFWNDGVRGAGVDVAVIDSGVSAVEGLTTPGKVVHGPDLSFEAGDPVLHNTDTYGHGTHLAGIIAGRDGIVPGAVQKGYSDGFVGMAPDSRVVSLKVANRQGATDVSQVIAAIDWVVQHRDRDGLNIRVLNLSFGTDGTQDYRLDPLAYAAEVAWRSGIVVVTAAGNGGYGTPALSNPASDPFVLAVGGVDGADTYDVADDVVPAWSSTGDRVRNPDLVAPGASVVSTAATGSYAAAEHPGALVGDRFLKGSGTSQSAAVVSGGVALLLSQRPTLTPDQVKALLRGTAQRLPAADAVAQGAGSLDLKRARDTAAPSALAARQDWAPSTGLGSLHAARGTAVLDIDGEPFTGEQSVLAGPWDPLSWTAGALTGTTWTGGSWSGKTWSGGSWSSGTWSGGSWSGKTWSGKTWSGGTWSGTTWSGGTWSGAQWR